jgi:hypothetical protein
VLSLHDVLYGRKGVRVRAEHEAYLEAVADAAREVEKSRAALSAAVCGARDADVPFRAIAAAAGVSHEQVRRIVGAGARRH